jgi:predicted ATPase/class 3 adenylate cyclase/Tfp pilus assembly protein PilF
MKLPFCPKRFALSGRRSLLPRRTLLQPLKANWRRAMPLPSGTITFLFTDIEGSTKLWEQHPDAMRSALARHDVLLRQAIEDNNGVVFKTIGDAFCAAFATAPQALSAALAAQCALHVESWPSALSLRVRMALHTGEAEERDGDYFGQTLNRVARLQAVGHGQQTLLSQTTYQLVFSSLLPDVTLRDMGQQRLKDLLAPEHVWQLLHPTLPSDFPPLKSLDYLPTNLPRQMTSFIGREREMAEVKRLLAATPLLTLVGSGGCGKTRLAVQVGADVLDNYQDGVWSVELAALADPEFVPQAVASVLGLREEVGRPLLQTIQDYLRDRRLLLLLDNCEHLVGACALLADTLLKACPQLTIVATSREPLGITGEHLWRVPSLLTPEPDDLPLEEKELAAALMEYDACHLFVERAAAQRQDFVLTRRNVPVVAHLCRQLDGIPLAIELAAARVRSLTVEEINSKLDNRFRLLTGGSRTALPRHQTLRALIDWSYDLLTLQEKSLLCRVSVFAGGWTLEAAEAVGIGPDVEYGEVLDLLMSLADKSLVVAEQEHGHTRYRLLETVRQYARDRLLEIGEGESEAVRECHRNYFLAFAETAEPELLGPEQGEWLERLEAEHENLRSGLDWSLTEGNSTEGLRFCGALRRYWLMRGHYTEGREWYMRMLETAGGKERSSARAKALNGAGNLAYSQGDYASAHAYYEESLTIRREVGDRSGIAGSLNNLGLVAHSQGDFASAQAYYEESLPLFREIGNRNGIANSLNNLGLVAHSQGDYASARAYYEESLTIKREIGDRNSIANSLNNLGNVAYNQGDYASAQAYQQESLTIHREIGDRSGIATSLNNLGLVAYSQGESASACAYYEESLTIRREIGDRRGVASSLHNLGNVAYSQGDYASCRAYQEESLIIRREIGDRRGVASSLEAFANLAERESKSEQAAVLYGAAEALREQIGAPLTPTDREEYKREMAQARQALGEAAFAAAWDEGRAMTWEQAVEYASKEEK